MCLVGGGQEINTGEAGITEWIESLNRSFPHWHIYISSRLDDSEYGAGEVLGKLEARPNVFHKGSLHLGVSMRSFRAENVSFFVKQLLDLQCRRGPKGPGYRKGEVSNRYHERPPQGKAMAEGAGPRFGAIWNRRIFSSPTIEAIRDRC